MPEQPITTTGIIVELISDRTFKADLPNGKNIFVHLPKTLNHLSPDIRIDTRVSLDFTPYDMEKARISAIKESGSPESHP